jgi:hypothetical protein
MQCSAVAPSRCTYKYLPYIVLWPCPSRRYLIYYEVFGLVCMGRHRPMRTRTRYGSICCVLPRWTMYEVHSNGAGRAKYVINGNDRGVSWEGYAFPSPSTQLPSFPLSVHHGLELQRDAPQSMWPCYSDRPPSQRGRHVLQY